MGDPGRFSGVAEGTGKKANKDGPRGGEPGQRRRASAAQTAGCSHPRRAGKRGGHRAAPRRERSRCAGRRGRSDGVPGGFPRRPPAGRRPASRSSSPHLGVGGERRATAGRRVCFQPRSLTWRPKSCHRACSGLPPLGWRRHLLPSRPASLCAPFPAGRLAAGGPRPRSIELERLERKRRGTDYHRVPAQPQPGWSVSLFVRPLTVPGRLTRTETEVRETARRRDRSHAQFVVSCSAGPSLVLGRCYTWSALYGAGWRCDALRGRWDRP